jgi:hypothetical protein
MTGYVNQIPRPTDTVVIGSWRSWRRKIQSKLFDFLFDVDETDTG